MKREELIRSREYWINKIQLDLYGIIHTYLDQAKKTKTSFAADLGVSKGYVSQVLNGDFDHKISKLVDLSLAAGKAPVLTFEDISQYILDDELGTCHIPINNRPIITLNIGNSFTLNDFAIDEEQEAEKSW